MGFVNQDGSVNFVALGALEDDLKAITDRLDNVDRVFAKAKMGIDLAVVFQCGESGLYYPSDYVKNWGKKYGIGLGPHPVSESLQSEYEVPPPDIKGLKSIVQIMHPLRVSCAQIDLMEVEAKAAKANMAILDLEDPEYALRAPILRAKQLENPANRIVMYETAWRAAGRRE